VFPTANTTALSLAVCREHCTRNKRHKVLTAHCSVQNPIPTFLSFNRINLESFSSSYKYSQSFHKTDNLCCICDTHFFSSSLLPHLGACSTLGSLLPLLEHRAEFPQFLNQGQSVGLLGRVISSSQGLYLYTNTEKRTHIHKH
jgi:hypothetical protein